MPSAQLGKTQFLHTSYSVDAHNPGQASDCDELLPHWMVQRLPRSLLYRFVQDLLLHRHRLPGAWHGLIGCPPLRKLSGDHTVGNKLMQNLARRQPLSYRLLHRKSDLVTTTHNLSRRNLATRLPSHRLTHALYQHVLGRHLQRSNTHLVL
jgi:hypothetical protein